MIEKQWIISQNDPNKDLFEEILGRRGLVEKEQIEEFTSPKPSLTYDPFLLKNMNEASNAILEAIRFQEKICIYGDYDADGICSTSLMLDILKKLGGDVFYYIPSRFDEGYGLNKDAIDKIKARGAKLVLTVDCGSSSVSEVEYAKQLGMNIIITDHHNLAEKIPDCLLINPKQSDCPYPEKNLSGCGVAFKLAQALQRKEAKLLTKKDLSQILDLVAIATIGDIVPLLGENRTMVKYGLTQIMSGNRVGIKALLKRVGIKQEAIKADQVAFTIVPYLNAAGRMVSADGAVDLMVEEDEEKALSYAEALYENNQKRKSQQNKTYIDALEKLEGLGKEKIIVLRLPKAHEGITGIVAGRIKEDYNLPVIIFTPSGDKQLKGTGRSIEGIDLYKTLEKHKNMYEKFGGHEGACGLTIQEKYFEELKNKLEAGMVEVFLKEESLFTPKIYIEGEIGENVDSLGLAYVLEGMEPFGHKNPKPIFAIKDGNISDVFFMGEGENHVRFTVKEISCIMFNGSETIKKYLALNDKVDLAGYLEVNRWNGREKLQFIVEDIKEARRD